MRPFSLLSSLSVPLVLAGCVSMAAQQQALDGKPVARVEDVSCNVEHIVQNIPDDGFDGGTRLDPGSISVLNWNVYKGQRQDWAADFRRFSHRHDVITIQEAHLGDDLRSLLDDEHSNWVMNAAFHYQEKATGVMTASRVRPVYSCGLRTLEPLIRLPKTSLVSYYPIEGMRERLLVANIHGINFTPGIDVYREQIGQLYSLMRSHTGPVVLAGDFNTWSEPRMQVVEDLARRLSLESIDYESHNRTRVFGNAIDHVFYRGLEPVELDTWHVASSDHNPMRVRFRVNPAPAGHDGLAERELNEDNS